MISQSLIPARVPQISIEIRDVSGRELITALEVLSPTNKRGEGYREYFDKRQRLLSSMSHLMEIDYSRPRKFRWKKKLQLGQTRACARRDCKSGFRAKNSLQILQSSPLLSKSRRNFA